VTGVQTCALPISAWSVTRRLRPRGGSRAATGSCATFRRKSWPGFRPPASRRLLLLDDVVRFGGRSGAAVDGQDVLGARGEGDDQIHLRAKDRVAPGRGDRFCPGEGAVWSPGNVHEQVERRRRGEDRDAEAGQRRVQIVAAVVVMVFDPEQPIPRESARG